MGGVPAAAGTALAGVFGSVMASDLLAVWHDRARDPQYTHANDDLTKLIGNSVALVLYRCADDEPHHGRWFKRLAREAKNRYFQLALHPALDGASSDQLPDLFAASVGNATDDAIPVLDEQSWIFAVEVLRGWAKQPENSHAAAVAARRLHQGLFEAIRESFKRDFEGKGRAYSALCLDMQASLLARLSDLLDSQTANRQELSELRTMLSELGRRHLHGLPFRQRELYSALFARLRSTEEKLNSQLRGIDHVQQTTAQIRHQQVDDSATLNRIEQLIRDHIAPKQTDDNSTQRQLPPELINQAQILLARGDREQQAVAEIALRNHDRANELIQDLKTSSLEETVRLLTLEGDNWYAASDPDKALVPYEQAVALRPNDIEAIARAGVVHSSARLGNIAVHQKRAIELHNKCLSQLQHGTERWAVAQTNLGAAWRRLPTGDRKQNIVIAIEAYQAALTVFMPTAHRLEWATTQNNLGIAWHHLPGPQRSRNHRRALRAYKAALSVLTREEDGERWAAVQNNLGVTYREVPSGDRAKDLPLAIKAFRAALSVYASHSHPFERATVQSSLGAALYDFSQDDVVRSVGRSMKTFEAASSVLTEEKHPAEWGRLQCNIGAVNMRVAMKMPVDSAHYATQAIMAFSNALRVYTHEAHPYAWATVQGHLATLRLAMQAGDREENLRLAIDGYERTLTVDTRAADAYAWAAAHAAMAMALSELASLKNNANARCELFRRAISNCKSSLVVYTPNDFPEENATHTAALAAYRDAYVKAGCSKDVPHESIEPAE